MPLYQMVAKTIRTITDTVSLSVEAATLTEAFVKSEQALDVFPAPHTVEGVMTVYVDDREYGEVNILDLEEEDSGIGAT